MKAAQVRSTFLEFFAGKSHECVRSAPLVPANDPTLMFTNAGMVQFKDVFTGRETRSYNRATSSQKCVRAGGKHNDLDEVGKTARHQTFFEMLGNFSFGDYFKREAIAWAWQLLIDVYKLDPQRLIVTVFNGDREMDIGPDDEARTLWTQTTNFGPERIIGLGKSENFWMMGDTGPMGPCSEIHYYMGEGDPKLPTTQSPEAAWDDWLEIWNLVFMQYERTEAGGPLHPLPAPSIDTGAGLERVTSVLQGAQSNYDTDLFTPLLTRAAELCGTRYGASDRNDTSMRVIADHARATTFLIADGVFPDNTGREYVLRRIFRRAVRHGHLLGISEPFMHEMCRVVTEEMSDAYPELAARSELIAKLTLEEETRFRATLDRGLGLLENEFATLRKQRQTVVNGAKVFQLYDTYGFPDDLTEIIASEHGFQADLEGFKTHMSQAKARSRWQGGQEAGIATIFKEVAADVGPTEFLGYQATTGESTVKALIVDGKRVDSARAGQHVTLVTDRSPFYAESGGQMGDTGTIHSSSGAHLVVTDTKKPAGDAHAHFCEVQTGSIAVGDAATFAVDTSRRDRIRANHSATHLLHLALKKVLGDHVSQKGSLVAPERLRFDFSHFSPVTEDQKQQIEDWVNEEITRNTPSATEVLPLETARQRGAVAMFGEKYGETVRVVTIGSESLEFCGGTHVARSGDIGVCKIVGESSVAQGVRRLEAVTGKDALAYFRGVEKQLATASAHLKVAPMDVAERVARSLVERRELEKQLSALKAKLAGGGSRDLLSETKEVGGVKVLATCVEVSDVKTLRETGDRLRDKLGSGIVFLIGMGDDKLSLIAMVTKDLTKHFHAGKLLQSVAKVVDGRGGGRPDMAQGGGRDVTKVSEALAQAMTYVADRAGDAK